MTKTINQNSYYHEGQPFIIECQFDNWTPETESMLMKIMSKNMDLLPGLKINKLYKQTMDKESHNYAEVCEDVKLLKTQISEALENLCKKYVHKEYEIEHQNLLNQCPTNITNCIRNCKKCQGKCLYMKEQYVKDNIKDYPSYLDYPLKTESKPEVNNYGYHEVGDGDLTRMPNIGC